MGNLSDSRGSPAAGVGDSGPSLEWLPTWLRPAGVVLLRAAKGFWRDDGPSWAAAVAYYSLLSLFPLLLALGWTASFFVDPSWVVAKATPFLSAYLPKGHEEIEATVAAALDAVHDTGWIFPLPLLWTGSLVFGALARGLNVAFSNGRHPSFLKRILVRLTILLTLGGLFLVALITPVVLHLLAAPLDQAFAESEWFVDQLLVLLPAALLILALLLAYRFLPRSKPDWRAAVIGAVVATGLFYAARPLFLGYVHHWARYSLVYGSLAGVIGAVLWTWIFAMIVLFGGQVTAACARRETSNCARRRG